MRSWQLSPDLVLEWQYGFAKFACDILIQVAFLGIMLYSELCSNKKTTS
jgi:hypothetical protein